MQAPNPVPLVPAAPSPRQTRRSARASALQTLCIDAPAEKLAATHALFEALGSGKASIDASEQLTAALNSPLPGRPAKPELIPPMQVPHRSPHTAEGLAALVHAICHIEFNAIKQVVHSFEAVFYPDKNGHKCVFWSSTT